MKPPPMDPELRESLRQEFQPEIESLGRLLGRDLSDWTRPGRTGARKPAASAATS
jgi:hypothetical protein